MHFLESLILLGCNNLYFVIMRHFCFWDVNCHHHEPKLHSTKKKGDHHFDTNRLVRLVIVWSNEIVCQGQTHLIIRVRSKACSSIQNVSQHLDQCGVVSRKNQWVRVGYMNLWWVVLQNHRIWFWTQTHNSQKVQKNHSKNPTTMSYHREWRCKIHNGHGMMFVLFRFWVFSYN